MQAESADVAALAARLTRLEEERAILAVLSRYCHTIDRGRRDAWLDCFTDDGVFAYGNPGGELTEVAGRDELAGWFEHHLEGYPPGELKHLFANPEVSVDGHRADAVSYFVTIFPQDGGIAVRSSGNYADTLRRCADGAWRIERREARRDMPR